MKQIKIFLAGKYLLIDEDNLPGLHSHETALQLAAEEGKRLMTPEERNALVKCKSWWDSRLKGRWFRIPTRKPLTGLLRFINPIINRFTMRDVFFEAAGYRVNTSGSLINVGTYGFYWNASPYSSTSASALCFNYDGPLNVNGCYSRALGLSVRCVKDL
jgi:hypothetical protein